MMTSTAAFETLGPLSLLLALGAAGPEAAEPDWRTVLLWLGGGMFCLWICLRLAPVSEALWESATVLLRRPATWLLPLVIALAGGATAWDGPMWQRDVSGNLGLALSRVLAFMHQPVIGAPAFVLGAVLILLNLFNSRAEASYQSRSRWRWRAVQIYLVILAPAYIAAAVVLWWGREPVGWLSPLGRQIAEAVLWLGHAHGAMLLLTALVVVTMDWRDNLRSGLGQVQLWLRAVREWPRLFPLAWVYAQLQLARLWIDPANPAAAWLERLLAPVFLLLLLALPVILAGCRLRFGHAGSLALEWWLRRPLSCSWFIICGVLVVTFMQVSLGFLHGYIGYGTPWTWALIQTALGTVTATWLVVGWVILIYDDEWLDELAAPPATRPY